MFFFNFSTSTSLCSFLLKQENLVDGKNPDKAVKPSLIQRNKNRLALDHCFEGLILQPLWPLLARWKATWLITCWNKCKRDTESRKEKDSCLYCREDSVYIYRRTSAFPRGVSLGEKLSHPMEGIEHTYCNSGIQIFPSPAEPLVPTAELCACVWSGHSNSC
jgi:hypothetical protein